VAALVDHQESEIGMTGTTTCADGQVIQAENLWRVYKVGNVEIPALRGVSLQIEQGAFVALKGRSGSGKTTLLNCLGGLDQPTSGTVRVLGQDLSRLNDERLTRWRREQVGFVFQTFGLSPTLSAYENVELMLRLKGTSAQERRERTVACLELAGVNQWGHHRPYEMSGGQQQRVAIARSLANQPQVILADEPTGELDSATAREILGLFRTVVREAQITLLMVTHDPVVDEFADQVLLLRDGQIVNS
jgi:putative ABC transport system ATP-binding protein